MPSCYAAVCFLHIDRLFLESIRHSSTVAEVVLSGTAVQLYLSLWNRAEELASHGRSDLIDQWRKQIRIRWS